MRSVCRLALAASSLALGWSVAPHDPAVASPLWSGTLADQMISFDDNEYARAVQIVITDPGTLHAVWGEDAPSIREIHHGRSSDGGATWTSSAEDRPISFPDGHGVNPEECDIGYDRATGALIVVWSEDVVDTREVHYGISLDDGASWSSEPQDFVLSDLASAVDTNSPSIVVDRNGVYHVVWHQVFGATAEVHYSRSTDGGATWSGTSADRIISFPDGSGAVSPQIACDSENRLFVAWREIGDSALPAIHVSISTDGGDTWSGETADREISPTAQLMTDLAIGSDPCASSGVHIVYRATYDTQSPFYYEIYSTSSFDGGATWDGESALTPVSFDEGAGRSASNPDIFALGLGAVVVWDEEEDLAGTNEQHVSFGGPPWTGATADSVISFPDGEDGYRPSVTARICFIPKDGGARQVYDTYVAWTEFAGDATDNYEVHLSAALLVESDAPDAPHGPFAGMLRSVPNPSAGGPVRIEWEQPAPGEAGIDIFDAAGRRVWSARQDGAAAGPMFLSWDRRDLSGRELPSGLYFARLRSGGATRSLAIVLL